MTPQEARNRAVEYMLRNAGESLESAGAELAAGRTRFAMNRVYYACFYATSAALLAEDRHFVKHAGVKAALHQNLVKPGRLSAEFGRFYNVVFQNRHDADYGIFVDFDPATVTTAIRRADEFVAEIKRLLESPSG